MRRPARAPVTQTDNLTMHVWPKSRMLFAIVSNMTKKGMLTSAEQGGVLKDLILEEDQRLLDLYAQYEAQGDRQKLYQGFKNIALEVLAAK